MAGFSRVSGKDCYYFIRGVAIVERLDERLNHAYRAIERARIAPGFQEMRGGDVPVAQLRGFVVIEAGMHARFNFQQRGAEIEIHWRVVDGIVAAEHEEQVHFAGVDVVYQVAQRFHFVYGIRFERVGVVHGLADVTQRGIHGVREGVHRRWLFLAGDDQRCAAMCCEIFGNGTRPFGCSLAAGRGAVGACYARGGREFARERFDVASAQRFAMVGHGSGAARHALDHVKAVQIGVLAFNYAARREFAGVAHVAGPGGNEIGVE